MSINFTIKKKDVNSRNTCLICNSKNLEKISEVFYKNSFVFFSTSLCKVCGYIFRNKHPSNQWFTNQFKKRAKNQANKGLGVNIDYEKFRLNRYKKLLFFLEKKISFKNLIDIGCATGTGLNLFNKKGYKTTGIDTDKTRVDYGRRKNINVIHSDIYKFSKRSKYDLILCIHTLEHFTNPEKALKKIVKLMHKESYIYIEVPDFKNLVRSWDDSVYLAHISNFSEKNLIYLLKKNNLKPLYRLYPQTENGEINIGILCKKNSTNNKYKITKSLFKVPSVKKYGLIGKNKKIKLPYKINLNLINDISFAYKLSNIKNYKIKENFKRNLYFEDTIKKYQINKKLSAFKIKKLKFKKNIEFKTI